MRILVPALVLATLVAGCSGGGGADEDPGPPAVPESDNGVLYVSFESDGRATLEVPTPSLDSCRSPQDWLDGKITKSNASVELRDASDGRTGRVLAITGQGRVTWSSQIDLGPTCQNIRYDPWSIDPDPEAETVEVRVADGAPPHASLLVRRVRDQCGEATLYDGQPATGWTAFVGHSIPASSCPDS